MACAIHSCYAELSRGWQSQPKRRFGDLTAGVHYGRCGVASRAERRTLRLAHSLTGVACPTAQATSAALHVRGACCLALAARNARTRAMSAPIRPIAPSGTASPADPPRELVAGRIGSRNTLVVCRAQTAETYTKIPAFDPRGHASTAFSSNKASSN